MQAGGSTADAIHADVTETFGILCAWIASGFHAGLIERAALAACTIRRASASLAEYARLFAISIRIAFDAVAFAVARIPSSRRASRSLGHWDVHRCTAYAGGDLAIYCGDIGVVVDGFHAAVSIALGLPAVAGNLDRGRHAIRCVRRAAQASNAYCNHAVVTRW